MTDEQIAALVSKEFVEKTWGVTEQYLEIHSPVYVDDELVITRIDRERKDDLIIAYLPVDGEQFYFAVYMNVKKQEITGIYTEAYHRVYFRATSETETAAQLAFHIRLPPTASRNKGDVRKNGKTRYSFSSIDILPNPEPDEFEDKLKKLLDLLEQDTEGIQWLADNANGYIQVAMHIHNGNGMIGGPHINRDLIRRMGNLGLSIDFDLYVGGKSFKEPGEE